MSVEPSIDISDQPSMHAGLTGDRNYSKAHPDSYENFIADYPNSIYANHALMNMVIHVYSNAQGGPSQSDRIGNLNSSHSIIHNFGIILSKWIMCLNFQGLLA